MGISFSQGCNTEAILKYIQNTTNDGVRLRAMRMYRKGETMSAAFAPHKESDRMHLYSLSKSFTSVCVGIAQDMGLLSVDEKMLDIFPECAPAEVSEYLAQMTLGDVLSMQSGHEVCHLNQMRFSENAVKTFLAMPVVYKPGTTFVYSTGGTCVCGAAVEKRAGMKLADFMDKYLFEPLGIKKPHVLTLADGTHTGGIGIFLSIDDLFRFGMMLLRGGEYNGKRIVSKAYLDKATSAIADNSCNGTPDWVAGYGYQFWQNAKSGFRGDGAYGQLLVVLPEEDTVFALQAEASNMQAEMDRIYELLDSVDCRNPVSEMKLASAVASYNDAPVSAPAATRTVTLAPNPAEIKNATLSQDGNVLTVRFETAYGVQILKAGGGTWVESHPMLRYCNPSINMLDPHFGHIETLNIRSHFATDGDTVKIVCKHIDTPHTQTFAFGKDALDISAVLGDLHADVKHIPYC